MCVCMYTTRMHAIPEEARRGGCKLPNRSEGTQIRFFGAISPVLKSLTLVFSLKLLPQTAVTLWIWSRHGSVPNSHQFPQRTTGRTRFSPPTIPTQVQA